MLVLVRETLAFVSLAAFTVTALTWMDLLAHLG